MRARLVTAATAAVAAALVPALTLVAAQPAAAAKGNKGTLKVAEVGAAADDSNNPHVGCTFDLQWYGFERSTATVSFESQAPTGAAHIDVTGPTTVELGPPAQGGDLNAVRTYTLAFSGDNPHPQQGYHVKVTTDAAGAKGATSKYKVFWVGPCESSTDPGTEDPGTDDPGTDDPGTDDPGTEDPGTPSEPGTPTDPGTPTGPFDWDWTYQDPTCTGVTVDYPADIPDGQANDVNIRVETPTGVQTLNFHNNDGTWSGSHAFNLADHAQWDAGTPSYDITWVQVGGTNYHWKGDVGCVLEDGVLKGRTDVDGFRTGTVTVPKGGTVAPDSVVVGQCGDEGLELQQWRSGSGRGIAARSGGHWASVKAVTVSDSGTARVTFPKLTRKGTYRFRLAVAGSELATGHTTGTLTVRVR